jgi:hypothetical protein
VYGAVWIFSVVPWGKLGTNAAVAETFAAWSLALLVSKHPIADPQHIHTLHMGIISIIEQTIHGKHQTRALACINTPSQ